MSSAQSTSRPTNSKSSGQVHVYIIDEEQEMFVMDDAKNYKDEEDNGADILDDLNGSLTDDEYDFACSGADLEIRTISGKT